MPRISISIHDVAVRAGVSRATVSRVLSGRKTEQIAVETRRRVESAVAELGYYPNAMARGLARSRTNTIGLVFLHTHQPLHTSESFVMMMDGILEKATLLRKDTLICTSYSWSDGRENLGALLDRRCDGLILVVPRQDNEVLSMLKEYEVPFVLLAGQSADPQITVVDTDNEGAACHLVHYLMDQGHRRIAFLWWTDNHLSTYAMGRFEGYKRAHFERGIEIDPDHIVTFGSSTTALAKLMQLPDDRRPTALFGVADGIALAAMATLTQMGWRVPEDISIVGYDDIPSAANTIPGLTTIRQPLKQMGERSVALLLEQIDGTIAPGYKEVLPIELRIRRSVAPPRSTL